MCIRDSHYSSLEKGQLVDGGFVVEEVSNDSIKLSIERYKYSGPFEEYDFNDDSITQLEILLNNGVTKEFGGMTQDAGTDYSLSFIK